MFDGISFIVGELITRANGDARGLSGRPTDSGQIGVLDPDCRLIGLYLYEGLFKVTSPQSLICIWYLCMSPLQAAGCGRSLV